MGLKRAAVECLTGILLSIYNFYILILYRWKP